MSTRRRIYLDFNATVPLLPVARDAMTAALADFGNPSSVHAEGRRMRDRVERARDQVAALVGRPREQVVFTSGGTEANALGVLALAAAAVARGLPRVVATSAVEHPSLRGAVEALGAQGWEVVTLRATEHGLEVGDVARAGVVAVGYVNHELGAILRPEILAWADRCGALVHVDAVQAAGKLLLDELAVDAIALSGHKLGGAPGAGALVLRADVGLPLVDGGHQERGRRPGTENVIGIVGMGAAAAAAESRRSAWEAAAARGERFAEQVIATVPGVRRHGHAMRRLGTTVNLGFDGALGESVVMALDLEGIAVSTGAACTSGSIRPSAVLLGLGLGEAQAREAVRFSLGPETTEADLAEVLAVVPGVVERARRHR